MKLLSKLNYKLTSIMTFIIVFAIPNLCFAAQTTDQVKEKLNTAATAVKGVLTSVVVVIGVIACLKIVSKSMPFFDDPHVKNEMWKSIFSVLGAVAFAAAVIWIAPWVYSLLD